LFSWNPTTGGPVARPVPPATAPQRRDRVVIRFAGDSGDGMQLTGDRFTAGAAAFGNDLAALPDHAAEIRAPLGTLAGVSTSGCTSPTTTSSPRAIGPTCWWR
jgi:hypothetical protein